MLQFGMRVIGMKKSGEKRYKGPDHIERPAALPKAMARRFKTESIQIDNRQVWTVAPENNPSDKLIIYLHGGAYVFNIMKLHWGLIGQLVKHTRAHVVVPDYPLAPQATCVETYAFMDKLYAQLRQQYPNKRFVFMGDSAGGGLALGYAQHLKAQKQPVPEQLILLAPWLDVSMQNPGIQALDKLDRMLNIEGLKEAGRLYAGDLGVQHSMASPVYGDFKDIGKISIFIGTYDLLLADCQKMKAQMEAAQMPLNYYEYPKMFHAFMVVSSMKESKHVVQQIVDLLKD
jgi:acetyl esterase/lipase